MGLKLNYITTTLPKLATTSTGIDVTGTVTADGLTVDGATASISNGTSPAAFTIGASNGAASNLILKGAAGIEMQTYNGGWKKYFNLAYTGDISFYDSTGTTPKFFWDASAESLGIGVTGPSAPLHVTGGSSTGFATVKHLELGFTANRGLTVSTSQVVAVDDLVTFDSPTATYGQMAFKTAGSEAMRIDASGNVDIGSTNGSTKLSIAGGVGTQNGTEAAPTHTFYSDLNTGMYRPAADHLGFSTGGSEAMRIDSSGNLLVGKTSANSDIAGFEANASGFTAATRDNGTVFVMDRLTSDGGILSFRKDNSTVGSIGTIGSKLTIGSGATGVRFNYAGVDTISPWNTSTNALTDGTTSLGYTGTRFKDLYLSGTVNAANFNTTSDATLKTNVETLTGSLDAVKSLRGVSYDWIESGGSEIGVIAQEVEAVLPDVVSTNDEGIKSVKYGNMVAVLIEAIKEQQVQIDELKSKLGE